MAMKLRVLRGWHWLAAALLVWGAGELVVWGAGASSSGTEAPAGPSGNETVMDCCGILGGTGEFPPALSSYGDDGVALGASLAGRVKAEPFNLVATVIFGLAIVHTFMAGRFQKKAKQVEEEAERKFKIENLKLKKEEKNQEELSGEAQEAKAPVSFAAVGWHYLGEVEAIFGIWVVPLVAAMTVYFGWGSGLGAGWAQVGDYFESLNFDEPVFVVAVMAVASTRPVVKLAEAVLRRVARMGGETPGAWWAAILTVGPLLGSLITEPAAMTISAMLLGQQFFALGPTVRLKYATLGLLFVNVSVGGTLTHFAAPPVLMVAGKWGWDSLYMLEHFGAQALTGIVAANAVYFWIFRREFGELERVAVERQAVLPAERAVPWAVTGAHVFFLGWMVLNLHHPALLLGGFLFFLGLVEATAAHQAGVNLKGSVMVGFFLAGLVIHGGLQGWWIQPVLERLSELGLFFGAMFLTAFNDNAAITYLSSLSPQIAAKTALQHAVMEGAVAGGGLTVIANAPNPAGQSLLGKHFAGGISPLGLLAGAALPTAIVAASFRVLGWM
jgi:hypothetical protein